MKNSGFDFFIIDTEHGGFDYSALSGLITTSRLIGMDCIVRLPDNTRREVTRLLDMGAKGVLLPMTESAEEISRVSEYAKYAPIGKRGISTMRAHTLYNPPKLTEYMEKANEYTQVFAQLESKKGLENAREILSADGVTGFMLGPNDLSCDLGSPGGAKEEIKSEIIRLTKLAESLGKASGIITSDEEYLSAAKRAGTEYYSVGSELSMLKQAALATVKRIEE